MRHVIVGSGIAGLSAAETIRRLDFTANITLISEERHDFYSRPGLAYLLRGDIPEEQLKIRTPSDLQSARIERVRSAVAAIHPVSRQLQLASGGLVPYDRLLLATGALAVPPTFPGGDLEGVVKLDGLDDARHILKHARRRRTAIVVGGGITALELAEGLRARGMRTHYFLRGSRYWSDVLDETESEIVLSRLRHDGVNIHLQTQIASATGASGNLTAIHTQCGRTLPCDVLAVAIGVRPRIDLARQAGLQVQKGIVVNPFLETSAAGVFAAGDCAEVFDPSLGVSALDVLWPIALAQGRVAGHNMSGGRQVFQKEVPFNVTQLAGLRTTIIGRVGGGRNDDLTAITRGESESWRLIPEAWVIRESDGVNRVRIVVDDRTIVGALVMGDQHWSVPLQRMISARVDIRPIRAELAAGNSGALARLEQFYQNWLGART